MQRATETESQTALMGTSCLFTLCHTEEKGMAPSLENAYAILTEENNAKSQWAISVPAAAEDSKQSSEGSRVGSPPHLELLVTELMPQK